MTEGVSDQQNNTKVLTVTPDSLIHFLPTTQLGASGHRADGRGPCQLHLKRGLSEVRSVGTQHRRAWFVRQYNRQSISFGKHSDVRLTGV